MSKKEYAAFAAGFAPRSKLGTDTLKAFVTGGLICCIGQLLKELFAGRMGLDEQSASTAVSMVLVAAAALMTGLGWYDDLARFAGAGTLVPVTGFSNAVVSPALEFKSEGFILGTASKIFSIAGPVIAFGVGTSVLYGLLLCVFS